MAPRIKYGRKKRIVRRRKYVKRGYKRAAAKTNVKRQTYFFKRRTFLNNIVSVGINTPTLTSTTFSLGQLPGISDFTSLFDKYKITYVKMMMKLVVDPSAQNANVSHYPTLYYCPDYDDNLTPASINDLREYGRTRMAVLRPDRYVTIRIKPAVLQEYFISAGQTSVASKWNQWVDMARTDIPHYGLKYAIDNLFNLNSNYQLEQQICMWFQCKDTR